ncbi:NAD(P)-binding protein [Wolfiporia cocos MD-104 SS10]|uniref:NAD(P)-binding protein n=1 Tax=Wolfiporia cocos (strain MD-104) TaxID=742152 RepID=A0A2H3JRP7_WOLCO|nr:NAD(P)-binding protein [Wolfiporia cocos MD-104 SS10]
MASTVAATIKRVALITGASQGIGKCIAQRLASDGLRVALNDIATKRDQLQDVAAQIRTSGGEAIVVTADVSREDDVKAMTTQVVQEAGGLDVMVANAGILGPFKPLHEVSAEEFDQIIAVNVRGVMLSYKHAAQQMIKQGRGGRIIGAASMAGRQGFPNIGPYTASKFAVRGLTHSAAKELMQHKITVNAYAPGIILTSMNLYEEDSVNGGPGSTAVKSIGLPPQTPVGEPEVIASLVSYLAKPEAHFITGQTITICGGIMPS